MKSTFTSRLFISRFTHRRGRRCGLTLHCSTLLNDLTAGLIVGWWAKRSHPETQITHQETPAKAQFPLPWVRRFSSSSCCWFPVWLTSIPEACERRRRGWFSVKSLGCVDGVDVLLFCSTFSSSDKLPSSLLQSAPPAFLILLFLKESVTYAQQLVCGGSGQGRRLTRSGFHLGLRLGLRRRGLWAEWIVTRRRVGAHSVYIRRCWQSPRRKGSVGRFWRTNFSFWK